MASFDGQDAKKSALREEYVAVAEHLERIARERYEAASMPKTVDLAVHAASAMGVGLSARHRRRIDEAAIAHFLALPQYRNAPLVLLPVPVDGGIDLGPIALDAVGASKSIGVPRTDSDGHFMRFYLADKNGDVINDEPLDVDSFLGSICVVPGLVFDAEGFRVADEGDLYDDFLRFYPGHKVALIRSLQVSSNLLPREGGEVAVDYLVSESSVWKCRRY